MQSAISCINSFHVHCSHYTCKIPGLISTYFYGMIFLSNNNILHLAVL